MEASFMNQSQYLKDVQTQMQHYQAQANRPTLFKKAMKYVTNVWDSKLLKFWNIEYLFLWCVIYYYFWYTKFNLQTYI